jgi:predicted DNA-binding antitoxin AbrB/MazE fold protein
MSEQIDAIYDGGVLKPVVPLSPPDKIRVTLTIDAERSIRGSSGGTFGREINGNLEPRDEWERQLSGVARDCGVSLQDSAVSSDGLYE